MNQSMHGWELETFFVSLNYTNPERSLVSRAHADPSNFIIFTGTCFYFLLQDPKLKVNRGRSLDTTALYQPYSGAHDHLL